MWVRSLGWEDLLEEEMATHSSILAWEIPWTEEPDGLQSTGMQRVRHWTHTHTNTHTHTHTYICVCVYICVYIYIYVCVYIYIYVYVYMLEKAMAPHSSTLAWRIPWTEEPRRLQSMGSLRVGHDWTTSLSLSCVGEGNGSPLQCSCLENPRDGGAWWAAVYGVAQSRTRLK